MQRKPIQLSCGDCGHSDICKIKPNVESMLASLFPENSKTKPVCKPEDFANICTAFIPKSQLAEVEQLKEAAAQELAAEATTA
ncbi:MAG: hypothetical protein PHI16_06110 [Methanocellales archaeon]|jgi:hypothetical protein|nr:hypothetical protein [Methanocellales archaeon]